MDTTEALLKAILTMLGRQAFPPAELSKLISPTAGGEKQLQAYNLCDGCTAQSEIGKRLQLDKGSLSRTISRWVEAGIVIRVGKDQYPMHIYPLPKEHVRSNGKAGSNK